MNIIEAVKSGKRFRKSSWINFNVEKYPKDEVWYDYLDDDYEGILVISKSLARWGNMDNVAYQCKPE